MTDSGSLTAAAVTNTTLAFFAFMPTPDDILRDEPGLGMRINEVSAAAVSIGLGFALTVIGKNPTPLLAALVSSVALIAGYEYLARTTDARIARARNEKVSNVRI